jgi:hypothetical protein
MRSCDRDSQGGHGRALALQLVGPDLTHVYDIVAVGSHHSPVLRGPDVPHRG